MNRPTWRDGSRACPARRGRFRPSDRHGWPLSHILCFAAPAHPCAMAGMQKDCRSNPCQVPWGCTKSRASPRNVSDFWGPRTPQGAFRGRRSRRVIDSQTLSIREIKPQAPAPTGEWRPLAGAGSVSHVIAAAGVDARRHQTTGPSGTACSHRDFSPTNGGQSMAFPDQRRTSSGGAGALNRLACCTETPRTGSSLEP